MFRVGKGNGEGIEEYCTSLDEGNAVLTEVGGSFLSSQANSKFI